MRSGDEPFVEVLLLQQLVRREVVRTIIFAGDGLFVLFTQSCPVRTVARWHVRRPPVRLALWLGLHGCYLGRGGILSGAYVAVLTAFRGNDPSWRPVVPRCRFL